MSQVRVPVAGESCPKCGAGLDRLVVGGVGDWRNKVICEECLSVTTISMSQVPRLVALQYGISEQAAVLVDQESQREFEQTCLGGEPLKDLPPALPVARWHARRLAARPES